MRTVLAPRAATILYDLLLAHGGLLPFLLPANICPIVPITFFKAGVPFEFVDISRETLHMDLEQAQARLRSRGGRYGGLLYSHTYGDPSTPQALFKELKLEFPQILLVDDRCLCVPDVGPDEAAPADVTLYSTGYAKIVDLSSGGYGFLKESVPHHRRRLPFEPADLTTLETNYKASLAAEAPFIYTDSSWLQTNGDPSDQITYLQRVQEAAAASIAHRRSINAVYNSLIPSDLPIAENHQLWRFNLRLPRKQPVLDAIFAGGLFASSHYASLVGLMGAGIDENARELAAHVVNLFNDRHYTIEMAERTAGIVRRSL